MAGVYARKRNDYWEYRFEGARIDGKRKQFSKSGFKTKKEALEAGNKAYMEYNQSGVRFIPSEISVADFFNYWLENYCEVNLKRSTIRNYRAKLKTLVLPTIGKYKLNALSGTVLQNLINEKFNEGYSRHTLSTIKCLLTSSLSYAIEPCRFISSSPMLNVKLPPKRATPKIETRHKTKQIVTPEQWVKILDFFSNNKKRHIYLALQIGYRCGLRLGEAFGLCWDDVDFENAKMNIRRQLQAHNRTWYFSSPKYDSNRTIDIDDTLLELLKTEYDFQRQCEKEYGEYYTRLYVNSNKVVNLTDGEEIHPIIRYANGDQVRATIMNYTGKTIRTRLGFKDFDYHSLRHTHTSNLVSAGANLKYIQERLGHKSIDVTLNIYAHVTDELRREQKNILNLL